MRTRVTLVAALAALGVAAPAQAARTRPHAFASCAQLVRYARSHYAVTKGVPEPPILPLDVTLSTGRKVPGAAPTEQSAAGSTAFSTTNTQEPGIDEPDILKTDGSTMFAVTRGKVRAVAVGGGAPRLLDSLALPAGDSQLLLRGSRLIAITSAYRSFPAPEPPVRAAIAPIPYAPGKTVVTEIDVSDPAAMKVTRSMTVDGTFVDARQNGATARLVISSPPPAVTDAKLRPRRAGWVPSRRFRSRLTGRRYVRPVAGCRAIDRPAQFSGLGMLTILTIDLDHGLYAADSDALMADAQVVYGSADALYVATQKWIAPGTPISRVPTSQDTVIHQFDVSDPDHTTFVASGEAPGYLLNQFSLSEWNGGLRVATTSRPIWWVGGLPSSSQSQVTVLRRHGAALSAVGQVTGLGKGQQIYSVRFLGAAGYVVTFRQVDPLYTLDLSDPAAPKVAGQLELEGYSSYLQAVGDGLLLGIGQAVSAGNEPSGTQLELFDVSQPAAPKVLGKVVLASGSSQAELDPHAFLFWPPTGLAVLPMQIADGFDGAIGYRVSTGGLAEAGRITQQGVERSAVVGDRLFTLSDEGLLVSDLATLARQDFVAF